MRTKLTAPAVRARKVRDGGEPLAMVTAYDAPSARMLPSVFSNHTQCTACRGTSEIRVHYCPGCQSVSGSHFHRYCRCGATWLERSAGHAPMTISLDDPCFVALCQHCGTQHDHIQAMQPRCCRTPEVSYHDTSDPREACRRFAA